VFAALRERGIKVALDTGFILGPSRLSAFQPSSPSGVDRLLLVGVDGLSRKASVAPARRIWIGSRPPARGRFTPAVSSRPSAAPTGPRCFQGPARTGTV